MKRKAPLLIMGAYGIVAIFLPLGTSAIFKASGFRVALDVLGVVLSLNAFGFLVHAAGSNWGKGTSKD